MRCPLQNPEKATKISKLSIDIENALMGFNGIELYLFRRGVVICIEGKSRISYGQNVYVVVPGDFFRFYSSIMARSS